MIYLWRNLDEISQCGNQMHDVFVQGIIFADSLKQILFFHHFTVYSWILHQAMHVLSPELRAKVSTVQVHPIVIGGPIN